MAHVPCSGHAGVGSERVSPPSAVLDRHSMAVLSLKWLQVLRIGWSCTWGMVRIRVHVVLYMIFIMLSSRSW